MKIGGAVKWTMLDRNTMAGHVNDVCFDTLHVRRVDGTLCYVKTVRASLASLDDILKACQFFERNKR